MRRSVFATLVGLLAFSATALTPGPPDLSGTWKMDASRSESAHQDVPIGPVMLLIRQTPDEFCIETRRRENRLAAITSETLTFHFDGTEATNAGTSGVPVKVKAHWDGPKFVAETTREINESTVTTLQIFRLGTTGKEMTVHKSLTVQHGYQGPGAERVTGTGKDVFVKAAKTGAAHPAGCGT